MRLGEGRNAKNTTCDIGRGRQRRSKKGLGWVKRGACMGEEGGSKGDPGGGSWGGRGGEAGGGGGRSRSGEGGRGQEIKKETGSSHSMSRKGVCAEWEEAETTARRAASEEGWGHCAANRTGNLGGGAGKVRRQAGKFSKVQEMAHGVRRGGKASAQGGEGKTSNR